MWDQQVKNHPRDPRVLFNAARIISFGPQNERKIALMERAQQLDPKIYTPPLAMLYGLILLHIGGNFPEAPEIKAKLLSSTDSELVGSVAREMMKRTTDDAMSGRRGRLPPEVVIGDVTDLLARAIALDPKNSAWPDLM